MKKLVFTLAFALLSTVTLLAQTKSTVLSKLKPLIPKEYIGHWQKGTFSLTSFEEYNGKYVGPANETSVSYVLDETGVMKQYFIANTNSYNCRMQVLGYKEGNIVFNTFDGSFEFEPTSGYYTTLTCMSKTPTKKPYAEKELYPNFVVNGRFKKDDSGNIVMITLNAAGKEGLVLKKMN